MFMLVGALGTERRTGFGKSIADVDSDYFLQQSFELSRDLTQSRRSLPVPCQAHFALWQWVIEACLAPKSQCAPFRPTTRTRKAWSWLDYQVEQFLHLDSSILERLTD